MNTLQRLYAEFGQSPWVDSIDRELIDSGGLATMIGEGIRGLTSNPTIFAKAVAAGYYDELIRSMHEDRADGQAIYEAIAVGDIRDAADLLRPVYVAADGADGLASIEVEPALAEDGEATLRRARELWAAVDRPNIFVKIPATRAGLPAIEAATAEGINVNITLMFSVDVYRDVARAFIAGLRRFGEGGGDVSRVASVASFFVSRVDTKVDKALDAIGTDAAARARGTAAVANAQLAYQAYGEIFGGAEFADLRAAGARVQRCLWASTSTKDPTYRDVKYVEALIGPDTVDTMPRETIAAMLDHGELRRTLDADYGAAKAAIAAIEALGIPMRRVTDELIEEGVAAFAKSFDELLATIEEKRQALATA
ncbi:MAG TPA: transaldolase [Candidatus Limnocylindria bacterium]|nr:transaldolase [Candidatus Limnocylindria bacterium]